MKIVAIYDNGGKTADRYTIITSTFWDDGSNNLAALGLSEDPEHPTYGISQWGACTQDGRFNRDNKQWRTRTDLGKLIHFEQLTTVLQTHIARRIWQEE